MAETKIYQRDPETNKYQVAKKHKRISKQVHFYFLEVKTMEGSLLVYKMSKFLRAKGYTIAAPAGIQKMREHDKSIEILKLGVEEKRFDILRHEGKQRALHVGTLWVTGRTQSKKLWVLNIYEREHIQELVELAEELSKKFSMDIQVLWTETIRS